MYTNLRQAGAASLFAAADKLRLAQGSMQAGGLIVWGAEAGLGAELSAGQAAQMTDQVLRGGSLLLTLGRKPGVTAIRLSAMLPTIGWTTMTGLDPHYQPMGEVAVGRSDEQIFGELGLNGRVLPYAYGIRPVAAVERGQGRYERYAQTIPWVNLKVPAGHQFWTRSLLNREWQVRMWGDDVFATPLLVTGRYGAGRVAVFASDAGGPDAWNDNGAFWGAVLGWLQKRDALAGGSGGQVSLQVEATAQHTARVTVQSTAGPVNGQLVARALTWEGALVGNQAGDQAGGPAGETLHDVKVAAGGRQVIEIPLPKPGATGYQACDPGNAGSSDAYDLRVGVLSGDQTRVIAETRAAVEFDGAVRLKVRTDNLYGWTYPFHAPGPNGIPEFSMRMGSVLTAYAYPPGAQVQYTVEIANGARNLAARAVIADETQLNNASVGALNDGAARQEKGSIDGIAAYGAWAGLQGRENVLTFTFPERVTISSMVLVGCGSQFRQGLDHNPGAALVEVDGTQAGSFGNLDQLFASGYGRARLEFSPAVTGTTLRLRMPWVMMRGGRKRTTPWLGDVEILGVRAGEATGTQASGRLTLSLRDVMSGTVKQVGAQEVSVPANGTKQVSAQFALPAAAATGFYRLEAEFAGAQGAAPLMTISGQGALLPHDDIVPSQAPSLSAIVTRGFRNCFPIGTGTAESHGNWAEPDDLVWAYSHNMKQIGPKAVTEANRLYVTDGDLRHYSTPWAPFCNGQDFFAAAAPNLVALMKQQRNWAGSNAAVLFHSDRWDSGPQMSAMFQWQTLVEFDAHLRATGGAGIQAQTKVEIAKEIQAQYQPQWEAWHLGRYVGDIKALSDAFAGEGKRLVLSAQGVPEVAGDAGAELAKTIQGAADDSTWGMANGSVTLTTGRQMGEMAFNPVWKLSTLIQTGFNTPVLNSPQWHSPVGTTEPSRRHCYDRAWRATVWLDGKYRSVYTCGYSSNVGAAYTLTENDWQQWWRMQERHSLIAPEAPIGAGLVISTSRREAGSDMWFSGGGEVGEVGDDVRLVAQTFQRLHEAGVSLPFAANIRALESWKGDAPLIVLNLWQFSDAEVATLDRLVRRGVKVAVFSPSEGGTMKPGAVPLSHRPGVTVLNSSAIDVTALEAKALATQLIQALQIPLQMPVGTAGYGFQSSGVSFVVVEDWMEEGRTVAVRLKASAGARQAQACQVNEHAPVKVTREGAFWVIEAPLRPGDGLLLAVREES
jgi:hypothetical protein